MRTSSALDRSEVDSLLKLYREADAVQEKTRILSCIASSPDPDLVIEVLNLMFSDEIREQDTVYVTARISLEARESAWIWLKENCDVIIKRWGQGMVFHHFIRDIVTPIPHLRLTEYRRTRLSRNRRTVNRAYGGVLSAGAVRERDSSCA